ncbi:D-lactate dehydrogenase [Sphingobium sp. DC-2]|uniref:D-lactate dehydrogenase n=1 Tax=Sphingobium sp. DC-2 TaxID=1303256 RepID=UPI0004C33593|nr:D-lactate dehydrogenase [Sphingobium sp. DC-2]
MASLPLHSAAPAADRQNLIDTFRAICGRRHVLTRPRDTLRYCSGMRWGGGPCLAVVRPASLVQLWRVLAAATQTDVAIIMQAANTGLTGGSTPFGDDYGRPVLIIQTGRIKGIIPIRDARQVICLPGSTLHELETRLSPLGREPHSVIGSSCIGASVIGGVCNNSGGALVQRGPAYTQLSLYARMTGGRLELVNELRIACGGGPETILSMLDRGECPGILMDDSGRKASASGYEEIVRDVDASSPARYNADPKMLCGASGSAGKVAVFAVRLDTFPRAGAVTTFYIGSNSPRQLEELRRYVLGKCSTLPISGEYIHREAFDLAHQYGKDTFLAIRLLGTARLQMLFGLKAMIDRVAARFGRPSGKLSDRLLQRIGQLFPEHLPPRIRHFRDAFEHHLILSIDSSGAGEIRDYLERQFNPDGGGYFECSPVEAGKAALHRFAVAGAAIRFHEIHRNEVSQIVALDVALRRNDADWFEQLPPHLAEQVERKIYYGHFFCHVLHQDYVLKAGADCDSFKAEILRIMDLRGAKYPAEHNVGHLYRAEPGLADFYRQLDPHNRFNPGLGKTSKLHDWQ